MIAGLLVILIILWVLGYIHLGGINIPDFVLLNINGRPITLWDILILAIVGWLIGILPRPFREIASVILVLWILSVLGIFFFAGLSNLFVLAIIIGVIFYLVSGVL